MSKKTDWLPSGREAVLEMARDWQSVIGTSGSVVRG
jgi:hypothetical protein